MNSEELDPDAVTHDSDESMYILAILCNDFLFCYNFIN